MGIDSKTLKPHYELLSTFFCRLSFRNFLFHLSSFFTLFFFPFLAVFQGVVVIFFFFVSGVFQIVMCRWLCQLLIFRISLWKWGNPEISGFTVSMYTTNATWPVLVLVYVFVVRSVYVSVLAWWYSNCNLRKILEPLVVDLGLFPFQFDSEMACR
jgi:hypothetical protein